MFKQITLIVLAIVLAATQLAYAQDGDIRMGEFIEIDSQWSIMVTGAHYATSLPASDNTSRYNAPAGAQFLLLEVTLWNRNHPEQETSVSTGSFPSTVTSANGESARKLGHGSSTYCISAGTSFCSSTTTSPQPFISHEWVFLVTGDSTPYVLDIEDGPSIGFTTAIVHPDAIPQPESAITVDSASDLTVLASFYNFGADPIQRVSVNASGTHFSASTWLGTQVWDIENNEEAAIVAGSGAIFSPTDPALLAVRGAENSVQLWNMEMQESQTLGSFGARVYWLEFSQDGNWLVSTGCDEEISFRCSERVARIYAVEDGSELLTFEGTSYVILSPDGHYAAYYVTDAAQIIVYDIVSESTLHTVELAAETVGSMEWNPQSQLFAIADGTTIHILEVASGSTQSVADGVYDEIAEIAFVGDDQIAVSGCLDKVSQWQCDASDMRIYDANGDNIATWETSTTMSSLELVPAGDMLLGVSFNQAWLWDFEGNVVAELQHSLFAFNPDNTLIVSSGSDRIVRVWGLQ